MLLELPSNLEKKPSVELNKELVKQKDKFSTKYLKLKEEIDELDNEINDLIYDLYGVKKYKGIIEKSLE